VVGGVASQLWRIAGSTDTDPINSFFVQPFINYNLKRGWAISTAPAITANWDAESGQVWTVPLGLGVSKVTSIGKQPMSVALQYYHNVQRPDAAGADLVRMQFSLLYPKGKWVSRSHEVTKSRRQESTNRQHALPCSRDMGGGEESACRVGTECVSF
jgi:hypothetical protein